MSKIECKLSEISYKGKEGCRLESELHNSEVLKIMRNVGRTDLLSTKRRQPQPTASEAGMAAVKSLRAALDSVLLLIDTSTGSVRPVAHGINFYDEVRNFEISLIRQALRYANGSQVGAATLLQLNPTTLNAKIKNYSINCAEPLPTSALLGGLRVAGE